jgi:hypothetical protein
MQKQRDSKFQTRLGYVHGKRKERKVGKERGEGGEKERNRKKRKKKHKINNNKEIKP